MHESVHVRQFLMKLRPEFEHCRAALLNRNPTPSMNSIINDLLAEEQRLQVLSQGTSQGPSDMTLVVSTSTPNHGSTPLTCRGYNKVGHAVAQYKDWCAYCRGTGHGIQDCRSRAYASSFGRGRSGRGRGRTFSATFATTSSESFVSDTASTDSVEGLSSPLTSAMLQQIVQALSAAGMSGSGNGEGTWEG
ncbi:uncharacterized protein LOC131238616 [Magnolia sinica]|uniref:uncharacterized protein LOC131238616 n=1 Tax=Magnolia sinica TaxID=86752 RepID=UPI00265A4990|nr:uncharacterized protein LOC131238616 [Magnolia sinica]